MTGRFLMAASVALVWCTPALAAPATVQLRVEGASSTIVEGPVTTDAKTLDKGDGPHPCDGTNGAVNPTSGPTMTSALDDGALSGGFSWAGTWFAGFDDFGIDRIAGDASDLVNNRFWGYTLNYAQVQVGGCQQRVTSGDEVLFAYDLFSKAHLLKLGGPAKARPGEALRVSITDGATGAPVEAATVGGATSAADGRAELSFDATGVKRLKAERPDSLRSNALVLCVSADGAGDCGVPAAELGTRAVATPGSARDSKAPLARIASLRDGARYARGPRLLRGTASDDTGVSVVKIALRRHVAGKSCRWWSGRRERFVGNHCNKVFFFAIGSDASWSYQLPHRLGAGRYVLDVKAFDRAGNRDEKFVRGLNRVVFEVGR